MIDLSGKIIVLDNVLTTDECKMAVQEFDRNRSNTEQYADTQVLQINNNIDNPLSRLSIKIIEAISFISFDISIDWSQVVEWKFGSRQEYHYDTASPRTRFTSITYLNAEFSGGETSFMNDLMIVPKVGRTVYFDGNYYSHGVNPVKTGVRYTLPIWYK